jgi:MinD superfamily P-loop ATPase
MNKEIVFSHEKGIYMYLGNFDSIYLASIEIGNIEQIKYIKNIEGLFSESFYESFIITNNNKKESIGSISFEAEFLLAIKDAESKSFSDIKLSVEIINQNGQNTNIVINDQTFDPRKNEAQRFNAVISKEDVLKLKEAHTLRLIFVFNAKKVEGSDYFLLKDVRIKSSGGVKFEL